MPLEVSLRIRVQELEDLDFFLWDRGRCAGVMVRQEDTSLECLYGGGFACRTPARLSDLGKL
jgi:hypothetical protein